MAPNHCTDRVNVPDSCTLHCESQSRLYGWVRVRESHGRKVIWMDGCEITSWVARLSIASNRDMLLSFAVPCVLECSAVLSGLGGYVSPFPIVAAVSQTGTGKEGSNSPARPSVVSNAWQKG